MLHICVYHIWLNMLIFGGQVPVTALKQKSSVITHHSFTGQIIAPRRSKYKLFIKHNM